MPKVLISDNLSERAVDIFKERGVEVDFKPGMAPDDLLASIAAYDGLAVRSATKVTAEVLDAGQNLKVVGRAGIGVDNIDVAAATVRGVIVMNTPFGNSITTAEHAIAMMMALARQIPAANASTHAGKWEKNRFMGVELTSKTLGIIGCGNIGSIVADRALGLKMKVIAYDPYLTPERATDLGVEKVELNELFARADFITLHVPLTDATRDIIDAKAIRKMRKGVRIINCARGGLIVEKDLKKALDAGQVAGAAIDVFRVEPATESLLFGMEQLVVTPHLGASTTEAQMRIAESIAEQTLRALRDEVVDYPVNMPRVKALTNPRVKYYAVLAEKLGRFAMQSLDFNPRRIEVQYRGELNSEEGLMVRRAFLKGFLKNTAEETITFVNAEAKAAERHIEISEVNHPEFADYHSAVRFLVSDHENSFSIGGVVFGENNYRLSQVNEFAFEVIPDGILLWVINKDRPGVIGDIGTILSQNNINISQFELSRNMPGGQAMSLLRVDTPVEDSVLEALRGIPNVVSVRRIII